MSDANLSLIRDLLKFLGGFGVLSYASGKLGITNDQLSGNIEAIFTVLGLIGTGWSQLFHRSK